MTARWLTFDCFGTLVDWRHGIATTGELLFPGRGWDVLDAYNRAEPALESERPHRRYRDVLTEGMRRAAQELSLPLKEDDASALAMTIPYWPVFTDVGPALGACRASGWRLALLTNCDHDFIALTLRRLPVRIDAVVTAEGVGAYKPDHAHFRQFEDSFGVSHDAWIHVAQSYYHDIRPAHALGLRRIWINRLGETDDPSLADAVLPDLRSLPSIVADLDAAAAASPDVRA